MTGGQPDLRHIDELIRSGRVEEALSACRTALLGTPKQAALLLRMARLLLKSGTAGQAVATARTLVEVEPRAEAAWALLADALLEEEQVDEAFRAYAKATALRRAPRFGPGKPEVDLGSSTGKLRHDIEQLEWLQDKGLLAPGLRGLPEAYRQVLDAFSARGAEGPSAFTKDERSAIGAVYNRLVYWDAGEALPGPAVNPGLDWPALQKRYAETGPGIVVVDDLLTPEALAALRQFCLASTIWYEFRYANGYLGAFMQDGFACPLLLQIAEELRRAMPGVFKQHALRKTWSFKCDSRQDALPVHADFAAVNVNFWLTPDSANLVPDSGGLAVWDAEAPADWDFARYNHDAAAIDAFLQRSGARPLEVGHRQNRALIFNSDLFHRSGALSFREGYENRRLNVTMLFGKREAAQ